MSSIKKIFWLALLLSAAVFVPGRTLQAEQIQADGFTFNLPEGFKDFPEGKNSANVLYSYVKEDPKNEAHRIIFSITKIRGTIGREPINPKNIPGHPETKVSSEKWKSFEVSVGTFSQKVGDVVVVARSAQVPLKPSAMIVAVAAQEAYASELPELLKQILSGVDGPSNWLTDEERDYALTHAITQGVLALIFAGVVGYYVSRRVRKKRAISATQKKNVKK